MTHEIDELVAVVADAMRQHNNMTPETDAAAQSAMVALASGFLKDVRRVADAMEQLAKPPEVTVEGVDTDEWKRQQEARDQLDERHVAALERLADLVDQLVQTNRSIG